MIILLSISWCITDFFQSELLWGISMFSASQNLLVILSLFVLVSCSPPHRHHSPPLPAKPPAPLSQCEKTLQRFEGSGLNLYVENKMTIPIHRVRQRQILFDCNGNKVWDRINTIRSPKKDIKVFPRITMNPIKAFEVFNKDTCNHQFGSLPLMDVPILGSLYSVTGDILGNLKIKADIAPAIFTFQVKKGLNQIYYYYYVKCLPDFVTGLSQCSDPGMEISGIYNIDIDYSEEIVPGIKEFHQECPVAK
jgi:hypothetical protein